MAQYLENPTQPINQPSALTWADDVMFVYENLSATVRPEDTTSSRYALHRWASDEKNIDKFLSSMVPKATDTLQKLRDKDDTDDESIRLERRAIAELKALLIEAVSASEST